MSGSPVPSAHNAATRLAASSSYNFRAVYSCSLRLHLLSDTAKSKNAPSAPPAPCSRRRQRRLSCACCAPRQCSRPAEIEDIELAWQSGAHQAASTRASNICTSVSGVNLRKRTPALIRAETTTTTPPPSDVFAALSMCLDTQSRKANDRSFTAHASHSQWIFIPPARRLLTRPPTRRAPSQKSRPLHGQRRKKKERESLTRVKQIC